METKHRKERRLRNQKLRHRYNQLALKLLTAFLELPQNKVINKINTNNTNTANGNSLYCGRARKDYHESGLLTLSDRRAVIA